MLSDSEEIRSAFTGTVLEGHPVRLDENGIGWLDDVRGDALTAWQAARSAVPLTGRSPVATGEYSAVRSPPEGVRRLAAQARTVDPWSHYRRLGEDDDEYLVDEDRVVEALTCHFPGAGLETVAVTELALPAPEPVVDRWIFDRALTDPEVRARALAQAAPIRGVPSWSDYAPFSLALLPTTQHWLARAWIGYFGALTHPEHLCAAAWQWHRRWGAELVASWGTTLRFTVRRPPTALTEEAWELAGQLLGVGGSLQYDQWLLAAAVVGSDGWFLHDRP